MSTDPYPDVTGDESGIVPPQSSRTSEWPKKLRTLTAAELDRLTIDNSGRFYWAGKLADYSTESKQAAETTAAALGQSMNILDQASYELGSNKSLATIEGELASVDAPGHDHDPKEFDFNAVRVEAAKHEGGAAPQVVHTSERTRLTLSLWQTI